MSRSFSRSGTLWTQLFSGSFDGLIGIGGIIRIVLEAARFRDGRFATLLDGFFFALVRMPIRVARSSIARGHVGNARHRVLLLESLRANTLRAHAARAQSQKTSTP